jgi:DNA-binding CsgD family transcriptional regulator
VAPDAILGREEELDVIGRFLDARPAGPRAVLLEGEAGIGKSTLWHEAVRIAGAKEQLVLSARVAEAEAKLSFTVLADLLEPVAADVLAGLPPPQRRALRVALLLDEAEGSVRPDARAVSLGALGSVQALASRGPITVAIDDVQWTDAPSARALAFCLRRLVDEPVTVIAARRLEPGLRDPLDLVSTVRDHRRLTLGPIDAAPMGAMLRHRLDRRFPEPLVARIHTASRGNPLFALELGRTIDVDAAPPKAGEPLPVPQELQAVLRERLRELPDEARDALLIAAASASPTVDMLEGSGHAVDRLVEAGIVGLRGPAIEFAHPLFASTVYASAGPASRRATHRRLAETATDPEGRARHLALSSSEPSEEVAAALDRAARQARARGAPDSAAELCELALAATQGDDVEARAARAKSLAANLFDAGDPPRAREILERTVAELPPGPSRAEALGLLSEISWRDLPRVEALLREALEEVGDEARLRAWFLADLAWVELDRCGLAEASELGRSALVVAETLEDNRYALPLSLSILALSESLQGRPAQHLLQRAISLHTPLAADAPIAAWSDLSSPAMCLGRLLTWEGRLDEARDTLESDLARYREQGHETASYEVLAQLADTEFRAGDLDGAERHAGEAVDVATEAGVDVLGEILPVQASIACVRGRLDAAQRDSVEGLAVCERTGDRWNEVRCRSALGLIALSLDQPQAACDWLEPLGGFTEGIGLREPGAFPYVPDQVEALAAVGELDRATTLTDRLEEQGRDRDRPLALGTAARCRALIDAALGDLPSAAAQLERSLELLEREASPFELARSSLTAGEIGRRMKQKRSAREDLDRAHEIFERIGAPLWAERTRRELARIGGRAPTSTGLTPTEAQIAQLVAEGRTNREVAEALFVSVHTVEANLKRVYRKLDVRSRTELARKL